MFQYTVVATCSQWNSDTDIYQVRSDMYHAGRYLGEGNNGLTLTEIMMPNGANGDPAFTTVSEDYSNNTYTAVRTVSEDTKLKFEAWGNIVGIDMPVSAPQVRIVSMEFTPV
jgi:hypothetical protein